MGDNGGDVTVRKWLLEFVKGFGKDDLLIIFGAAFIFRGFWYWDPALSFLSIGVLALVLGAKAAGLLGR